MVKIYSSQSGVITGEIRTLKKIENDLILRIQDIKKNISTSEERIYPGIYGIFKNKISNCIAEASAFDERAIQDVKYHEKADEIYYVLEGAIRIIWKENSSPNWKEELIVSKRKWIQIPNNHCLLLKPASDSFLAVAFKTEISKLVKEPWKKIGERKAGKIQGTFCLHKEKCNEHVECEVRQKIRAYFFDLLGRNNKSGKGNFFTKINNREKAIQLLRKLVP